jgi:hypothetical protein
MPNYISFDSESPAQQVSLGTNPKLHQKRLLAQLLLQQGLSQRPTGGHWSNALPQAANQILGALLGRQANEELKTQQDQDQADMAKMLEGGRPQTWTNPDTGTEKSYGGIDGLIDAGLKIANPRLLSMIQAMQLEKYKTDADLAQQKALAEYEQQLKANQPVKLGPNDTYFDPKNRQAIYTAPGKSNLLTPEEAKQKIDIGTEIAKARRRPSQQQVIQGEGGFYAVDKSTSTATPIVNERGERIAQSSLTPQVQAKIKDKLVTMQALKRQLETVKEKWTKIKDSSSAGAFGQGYIPTEAGKGFDAAVDVLRLLFRQVSRTPGEGAMSDYETRLAQAPLPNRTQYESVTEQQIAQIEDMVAAIESGYQGMLGNGGNSSSSVPAGEQQIINPQTGEVRVLRNGQWVPR